MLIAIGTANLFLAVLSSMVVIDDYHARNDSQVPTGLLFVGLFIVNAGALFVAAFA